jgi:hypothetical protein
VFLIQVGICLHNGVLHLKGGRILHSGEFGFWFFMALWAFGGLFALIVGIRGVRRNRIEG